MLVDPIAAEILGNHLLSITEEMTAALIHSAYSANIKERWDCSSAILTPEGEVVAQAAHAPLHLGGMLGAARALLRRFPGEDMRPGDVFAANDSFLGSAIHLNDVTIAAPVFSDQGLVALAACVAHHADLGGRVPGGEACTSRSIYEEGLRLPPVRIFQGGSPLDSVLEILSANSRNTIETMGDFRAQFAAVGLGVRRFHETIDRHGIDRISGAITAVLDSCERRFRAVLRALPAGVYECTDHADDDWVSGNTFPISVRLEIGGDTITIDLTENVDQLESSRNVPEGMLLATIYYGLKAALDPGLPPNSGYCRMIRIVTRDGSIFQPRPPAAVALGSRTCQILLGAMFGALAQVIPERICAGSNTQAGIQLYGWNPHTGRAFLNYERVGGGIGARQRKDGLDGVQFGITNTSNLPIEVSEAEYPLRVERYELVTDSGGPGEFRGGLGVRREIRVLVDNAVLTAQGGRIVIPPPGLFGGLPGSPGVFRLNVGSPDERRLPTAFAELRLRERDVLSLQTAGGGGFGNPAERDPLHVKADVLSGRVTSQSARDHYKVELRSGPDGVDVDWPATKKLRSEPR